MKTFNVSGKDAPARLDKFILKHTADMPKSLLYKYFRKGDIKVNGKRCRDFAYILSEGDSVDAYLPD